MNSEYMKKNSTRFRSHDQKKSRSSQLYNNKCHVINSHSRTNQLACVWLCDIVYVLVYMVSVIIYLFASFDDENDVFFIFSLTLASLSIVSASKFFGPHRHVCVSYVEYTNAALLISQRYRDRDNSAADYIGRALCHYVAIYCCCLSS